MNYGKKELAFTVQKNGKIWYNIHHREAFTFNHSVLVFLSDADILNKRF